MSQGSGAVNSEGCLGAPPSVSHQAFVIPVAAGIGTEWMFANDWTAKLEYLFADLGSETFSVNTYPITPVLYPRYNPRASRHGRKQ
jgi:opacity protein-like surface antigen